MVWILGDKSIHYDAAVSVFSSQYVIPQTVGHAGIDLLIMKRYNIRSGDDLYNQKS